MIFCASVSAWLNILYASHSLAPGALFPDTIPSGPEMIATIGFQKISKKGSFFLFLYFHFATIPAAFFAFLFQADDVGLITT